MIIHTGVIARTGNSLSNLSSMSSVNLRGMIPRNFLKLSGTIEDPLASNPSHGKQGIIGFLVLTNSERKKRKMTNDDLCPRCSLAEETIMHALRDCDLVKDVWEGMIDEDD